MVFNINILFLHRIIKSKKYIKNNTYPFQFQYKSLLCKLLPHLPFQDLEREECQRQRCVYAELVERHLVCQIIDVRLSQHENELVEQQKCNKYKCVQRRRWNVVFTYDKDGYEKYRHKHENARILDHIPVIFFFAGYSLFSFPFIFPLFFFKFCDFLLVFLRVD